MWSRPSRVSPPYAVEGCALLAACFEKISHCCAIKSCVVAVLGCLFALAAPRKSPVTKNVGSMFFASHSLGLVVLWSAKIEMASEKME